MMMTMRRRVLRMELRETTRTEVMLLRRMMVAMMMLMTTVMARSDS